MPRSKKTNPPKLQSKPKPKTNLKSTTKNTQKTQKKPQVDLKEVVEKQELKFHQVFPIKLEHIDKHLKEKKICYFQCKEHLHSYIKRYKLKKSEYLISDTEPR